MTEATTVVLGLTLIGSTALVGAFVLWRRAVDSYRDRMDDHTALVFTYVTPLFMFLTAGPIYDVVILYSGGPFPTIGAPGVAVGLVGSVTTLGWVLFALPSASDPTDAVDSTDAAA